MTKKLTNIDIKDLEEQLEVAIKEDEKYWLQNDVKLKAVSNHVESYEEFKNLVDTAHLKPLDKNDKIDQIKNISNKTVNKNDEISEEIKKNLENKNDVHENLVKKSNQINSTNMKKEKEVLDIETKKETNSKQTHDEDSEQIDHEIQEKSIIIDNDISDNTETLNELIKILNKDNFLIILKEKENKLNFLKELKVTNFVNIFEIDIKPDIFIEIIKILLNFDRNNINDICFVIEFLGELINIERLSITLSFLNKIEKNILEELFDKLNSCFILKKQELNEFDYDEDTLATLKIVYQL